MALINVKGRKPRLTSSDGHGYNTPGKETPALPQRNGQRMKEKEFNEAVQNYLHEELVRCGFEHKDVAPGRTDVPLATRSKAVKDFKADLHIDIHANAFNGVLDDKGGGIETLYDESSAHSKRIALVLHKHIMEGTKMKDRGLKPGAWLHMVKAVRPIPSILVELGFMDNKYDVEYLLSDAYRRECAEELAKGICEVFGMPYVPKKNASKPTTPTEGESDVPKKAKNPGAFTDIEKTDEFNAVAQFLKDEGIFSGYPDGRFGVNENITRKQVGRVLYRLIQRFEGKGGK